jgi:dolichol-phosphate mannosyltransferase
MAETTAWRKRALAIVVGLTLLRLGCLGLADLFPEEAYYWNYARHLDIGYLDHPPMVAWLIHLGTSVLGHNEFGVRIAALLCSLGTAFFAFKLAELLCDRRASWTACSLAQVLPFFFMTGFMMTPDAPLTLCWSSMLYFLACVFFRGSNWSWLGVGVCLGLGMLSKYTIALLGPATLLFMLFDAEARSWFKRPAPYAAVLLSAAIFAPVVVWNSQHDWASFSYQSADRIAATHRFSTHELIASILALLTPLGVYFVAHALIVRERLDPSCEIGVAAARRQLFYRIFILVPLAVYFAFSLTHRVKLNWTGPLWLAVVPGMAACLLDIFGSARFTWLRRAWIFTIVMLLAGYVGLLSYLSFRLPGMRYTSQIELLPVGWSELGHDLEQRKIALQREENAPAFIAALDRNFIASEAAFYALDQNTSVLETTGSHLFGARSLMYEFWFPTAKLDGANLLLVSFREKDLKKSEIAEHCGHLDPIERHRLQRGSKICSYYTRVAYGYQSRGY